MMNCRRRAAGVFCAFFISLTLVPRAHATEFSPDEALRAACLSNPMQAEPRLPGMLPNEQMAQDQAGERNPVIVAAREPASAADAATRSTKPDGSRNCP